MYKIMLGIIACIAIAGCANIDSILGKDNQASAGTASQQTAASEDAKSVPGAGIHGDIPAGSPFSKVQVGMSNNRVSDLIGQPTSQKAYTTGKAWIPFYFGSDVARLEYRYKGQGTITFTGGRYNGVYTVYRVIYDRSEDGYMDSK